MFKNYFLENFKENSKNLKFDFYLKKQTNYLKSLKFIFTMEYL